MVVVGTVGVCLGLLVFGFNVLVVVDTVVPVLLKMVWRRL